MSELNFSAIKKIYLGILGKLAPLKKKYLRANHTKLVTKELRKAMLQTKLRNQFLKGKTHEPRMKHNKVIYE